MRARAVRSNVVLIELLGAVVVIACGGSSPEGLLHNDDGTGGGSSASGGSSAGSAGSSQSDGGSNATPDGSPGSGGANIGGMPQTTGGAGAGVGGTGAVLGAGGAGADAGSGGSGAPSDAGAREDAPSGGGSTGTVAPNAAVSCGPGDCDTSTGGHCCFAVSNGQVTNVSCQPAGAPACIWPLTQAGCDGPEDCQAPAVCCGTYQVLVVEFYSQLACATDCAGVNQRVICRGGGDCASGNCAPSLTLPSNYAVCL